MPSELKFNVGMNKTEFMTGSKEVARAIASLKTTVMQAGKSMNSSAVGYGTAMRQYSKVSREASQSIQSIKTRLDSLRQSTTAIKSAADAFRMLDERIKSSEKGIEKMQERMNDLESSGGKYTQAWQDNQKNVASANAELQKYTSNAEKYKKAYDTAVERLNSNTTADGSRALTKSERASYTKDANYNADIYNRIVDRITAAQAKVDGFIKEQDELIAQGQNIPTEAWQKLQTEIDSSTKAVENMKEELGAMKQNGFENADQTSEYTSQVNAVKSLEAALDAAQSKKNELIKPPYLQAWDNMPRLSGLVADGFGRIQNVAQGALYAVTHPIQAIDRALGTVIAKTGQAVSAFARMAGSAALSFLKRLASEAKNAAIQLAKMAANAVTSGFKKVASGAATAAKGVLRFNRAHKGTGDTLKMGLRNILRYAFGIRSMFFLFRRLRAAISEGFGELKKQNPEVKASLDSLSASFNGLKASLASAFAPILTAVAPALTTLINMLTAAMNVVAAFMAALGGGKTYSKAVGGMKATGKAAGGAGKKVKELKRELASFDELTIINDQNKSGGGGGGGGGGSALKYQTEQIPGAVQGFVDSLIKAWGEGDYFKVGNLVAEKINGVFESALKLITWENVEDKVEAGVSAVTGVFNGLTDPRKGINFKKIGITFSEGVRTLINSIDRLIKKISTANIGIGIANFLNGFISNTALFDDAKQGIQDITDKLTGLAAAFLNNFDEATLAQRIRETLGDSSMWENIGYDIWNVIKLAFNKTGNFLNVLFGGDNSNKDPNVSRMMRQRPQSIVPKYEIDSAVFDDLAENFANKFNEFVTNAKEFITGLPAGQVASAITKWLFKVNNGVSWSGVGSVIGASLRQVFNIGKAISKEIRQKASTLGENLAKAINAIIKEAFPEGGGGIGQTFSDLVIGAFDFITAFMKQFDEQSLIDKLKTDVDWGGIANAAWEAFKTAVEKLGNFLTLLFGGDVEVKPDVVKPAQKQKGLVTDAGTGALGDKDLGIAQSLAQSVGTVVSAGIDIINKWIDTVPWSGIGDFLGALPWAEWGQKLADALQNLFTNLAETIHRAFAGAQAKEARENAPGAYEGVSDAELTDLFAKAKFGISPAAMDKEEREQAIAAREQIKLLQQNTDALNENSAATNENTTTTAESNIPNLENDNASALFDKAMELIKSGTNRDDALKSLEAGGASPDKLSAVDEALDHVHHELLGWVEDDKVKQILDAADKTPTISPEESKALFDDAAQEIHDAEESLSNASEDWEAAWRAETEDYVRAREEETTQAGEFLRETYGSLGDLITGRAHAEEGQGVYSEAFFENADATKRQTKEESKLNKTLKKKGKEIVDVNYEGAGFDTSGERPTLNVGVNFAPNGEEASEENTNGGLLGWLQTLLDPGVSVETKVAMIREGWTSFLNFLGIDTNNPLIQTAIQLLKDNFVSFLKFLGVDTDNPIIKTLIDLLLGKQDNGAQEALDAEDKDVDVDVDVNKGGNMTVKDAEIVDNLEGGTTKEDYTFKGTESGNLGLEGAENAEKLKGGSPALNYSAKLERSGNMSVEQAESTSELKSSSPTTKYNANLMRGGNMSVAQAELTNKLKDSSPTTKYNANLNKKGNLSVSDAKATNKFANSSPTTKYNANLNKKGNLSVSDAKAINKLDSKDVDKKVKIKLEQSGDAWGKIKKFLSNLGFKFAAGGIISRSGKVTRFASGGAIMRNGRASWWNSVNKYAAGTTRAHGTVFVAGENGPEIMGHVNGRTEILNKSQLADAMYGAVVAGMANAVNSLGSYLANRMATCTNAIVSTISANSDISALAGMNYYAPAMATGGIMPYDVAMQISRSAQDIQNTLNANNEDLIQAMVSAMGNAANSIVQILQRQMMQNNVSSRGNRSTDTIDAINRQSLMFGKSPLKGV